MNLSRVHPDILRPLRAPMRGVACDCCNRTQSSWWADKPFEDEDKLYMCSLCVLYTTEWGEKAHERVEVTIGAMEKQGRSFDRAEDQKLTNANQADNVLGAIILALRMEKIERTSNMWKQKAVKDNE